MSFDPKRLSQFRSAATVILGVAYSMLCIFIINRPLPFGIPSAGVIMATVPIWVLLSLLLIYPDDRSVKNCSFPRYLGIAMLRFFRFLFYLDLVYIAIFITELKDIRIFPLRVVPTPIDKIPAFFILSSALFIVCSIGGGLTLGRLAKNIARRTAEKKVGPLGFLCILIHFTILIFWYYLLMVRYREPYYNDMFIGNLKLPLWLMALYTSLFTSMTAIQTVVECFIRKSDSLPETD